MNKAIEFFEAYYVECIIWGIIAVSGAALCFLTYVTHPTL